MQEFTQAAQQRIDDIASRHGVSTDAVATLLRAVSAGGGGMAQFSHPELGGMGQWSQGGMIMVGDMFNQGLKSRVDALCNELAGLLHEMNPFTPAPKVQAFRGRQHGQLGGGQGLGAAAWWPAELGNPSSSGGQNDMRYAYFPGARRLAVQQGGTTRIYDTGTYQIFGVGQQQGHDQSLTFSTDRGTVRTQDLAPADGFASLPVQDPAPSPAEPRQPQGFGHAAPPRAPLASDGDPLAMIEKLAALRQKGILTDEEFAAKKAELLGRL